MTDLYDAIPDAPDDPGPFERMEPHDLEAEQAYIGALLVAPKQARENLRLLAPADFYRPAHATIHQTIAAMLDRGEAIDPITVSAALQQTGELPRIGGRTYLHTCVHALPTAANADWYADRIRQLALRRALITTGTRIAAMGYAPEGDPAELAEHAVAMTRDVRDAGRAADDQPTEDMWDFLQHQDTHDWIVPGLLERMDRLIITGGEGGGKSVLMRQLAVCLAAGLHPFHHTPNAHGRAKVLVLDCENSQEQSRRHYRRLMNIAASMHHQVPRGQLHIHCRPEGVDLTKADGRAWLMRRIERVMPDVLVIGPIYQLHTGDPNSEEHARKVTIALTEARVTARCALLMEAHSAKASGFGPRGLAPVGSSLWLRWPEFGFGLRPVEDERTADEDRGRRFLPWRGLRDDRAFPQFLRQGPDGGMPWVPYRPIDADPYTGNSPTGALS
jgi:replicative DNA helicase